MSKEMRNILVIGNGFDLAIGLPTKYSDFIRFVNNLICKKNSTDLLDTLVGYPASEILPKIMMENAKAAKITTVREIWISPYKKELTVVENMIRENVLFKYLKYVHDNSLAGENWIDFESEISIIVQLLDDYTQNLDDKANKYVERHVNSDYSPNNHQIKEQQFIELLNSTVVTRENYDKYTFRDLGKRLFDDLQRLICALEIYLPLKYRSIR